MNKFKKSTVSSGISLDPNEDVDPNRIPYQEQGSQSIN